MRAPHRGAPSAAPTVIADPFQPITSPRRCSGTIRTSIAVIADSAGAHGTPAITTAIASSSGVPANAAGIVSSARMSTSTSGWIEWLPPP